MSDFKPDSRNQISHRNGKPRLSMAAVCLTCLLPLIAPAAYPSRIHTDSPNEWRSGGPSEAIYALAVDPVAPTTIYAGGKSGVFKSSDGGAGWSKTGLTHATVALAIDYTNPDIIYAGTSPAGLVFAPGAASLWKSTDGGATWSDTGVVDWDTGLLVMDPISPTTLYAGSFFRFQEEGDIILWKTSDGGGSWHKSRGFRAIPIDMIGLSSYGWAISPEEPHTIYAGGVHYVPSAAAFDRGLFCSRDGGTTWNRTGLRGTLASVVAINPSNPKTLYAGTVTNGWDDLTFRGLLKSTDAGESWFAVNNGLGHLLGTRSSLSSLVIDPLEPNTIYAGTLDRGVFRSANGGASWSEFNPGLTDLNINALAIGPTGRALYAATDQGVFGYRFAAAPCAEPLPVDRQSFAAAGGTGSVDVTAAGGCRWTAVSYAGWIEVASGGSNDGSGTTSYSVTPNRRTAPRAGIIEIAEHLFIVSQDGVPVRISSATVTGRKLFVAGENFDPGAVILLNGEAQKTRNDDQTPETKLIGKKAGEKVKPGDRLRVQNPDGSLSEEHTYSGS